MLWRSSKYTNSSINFFLLARFHGKFRKVPVWAWYITGNGSQRCQYQFWHMPILVVDICDKCKYQYKHVINSTGMPILVLDKCAKMPIPVWAFQYRYGHANTGTPPLSGQILVLVICTYWYPALLYSTSKGPQKMPV
jgi:hypothetical protein